VIVTELLTDGGFNPSNEKTEDKSAHYSNLDYWKNRTAEFFNLLPHVDGLISVSEALTESYRHLNKRLFYLPLAAPGNHIPLGGLASQDKDIDVIFTGSLTPYRTKILQELSAHGLNVFNLGVGTPEFLRHHYFARSRLSVGLRLSTETLILSKFRAWFHLVNRIPHLFEPTPDKTDLDEYIHFCDPGRPFAEQCVELARSGQSFPHELFTRFRESKRLNHLEIFSGLKRFLYSGS